VSRLRVLHVDTERSPRGGQRQLALLLAARTHDAVVVAPRSAAWPSRLDAPVHRARFVGRVWGRAAIRRSVAALRPDVVAVHTHHALALALGLGPPVVVHRRVDFAPSRVTVARYARVASVIAVSAAVARVLRDAGVAAPVDVVHDAVVPLPPGPRPEGPPHVVAIGALVAHKGHEDLLRAMIDVRARLTIAGEGALRPRLRRRVRRLGLGDRGRLAGHVDDVPALLRQAHVLCHPSRGEGLGQVVLEALTAGVPVVATRVGGLPEVIGDRGVLVPPAAPRALAAALRDVLACPGAARRRTLAGRDALVARHAVERLVARTEAVYRRVGR